MGGGGGWGPYGGEDEPPPFDVDLCKKLCQCISLEMACDRKILPQAKALCYIEEFARITSCEHDCDLQLIQRCIDRFQWQMNNNPIMNWPPTFSPPSGVPPIFPPIRWPVPALFESNTKSTLVESNESFLPGGMVSHGGK